MHPVGAVGQDVLFDFISHAHRSFSLVNLRSYVDDMSQAQHGSDISFTCDTLVPAAAQLVQGLKALECVISTKSAFVASHAALREELSRRFKAAAIPICSA
eukprot:6051344-Pyramimonas_sp.AAC.1